MSMAGPPVSVLGEDECWSLLSSLSLGRFVISLDGRPEIFPVNYVTQRPTVLFRTAEGTKLFGAATQPFVAFEADYHDPELTYGWSVILKGRAHVLSTIAEIGEAERAHLRPWTATQKLRYVRVNASEITGRRFKFGPEPDHAVVYD
jgi:uncharacterized protein